MRIVAFGDSIAYGAWDTNGGWVERLKASAHETTVASEGRNKIQVINLGIGGNTSAGLLKRIDSEIQSRVSSSWPFVFIISIGTNDGRSINGVSEVSIEEYENNVREIMAISKRYTDKILILGLPPLGAEMLDFKGQLYSDDIIRSYDAKLKTVAEENELTYVSARSAFEDSASQDLYGYDLLHPNAKGHALIASVVTPYLEEFGVNF